MTGARGNRPAAARRPRRARRARHADSVIPVRGCRVRSFRVKRHAEGAIGALGFGLGDGAGLQKDDLIPAAPCRSSWGWSRGSVRRTRKSARPRHLSASRRRGRSIEKTDAFHDYPGSMRDETRSRLTGIAETAEGEGAAERNVGLSGNIRGEVKLRTAQTTPNPPRTRAKGDVVHRQTSTRAQGFCTRRCVKGGRPFGIGSNESEATGSAHSCWLGRSTASRTRSKI